VFPWCSLTVLPVLTTAPRSEAAVHQLGPLGARRKARAVNLVARLLSVSPSRCRFSIRSMKVNRSDVDVSAGVVVGIFERGSGVPATLQRLGARVAVEPLAAGDYRIAGGVLVERKTVADLHGSLGRGRFWAQVGRIRDAAVFPLLLVEGDELDAGPLHPNVIRGALLAVAELGVAIVRSRDPADSALWLHRLALRQARKERTRSRRRERPAMTPPGGDVLAAVPASRSRPRVRCLPASAASEGYSRPDPNVGRRSKASAMCVRTRSQPRFSTGEPARRKGVGQTRNPERVPTSWRSGDQLEVGSVIRPHDAEVTVVERRDLG
jgi:hypothetical protein